MALGRPISLSLCDGCADGGPPDGHVHHGGAVALGILFPLRSSPLSLTVLVCHRYWGGRNAAVSAGVVLGRRRRTSWPVDSPFSSLSRFLTPLLFLSLSAEVTVVAWPCTRRRRGPLPAGHYPLLSLSLSRVGGRRGWGSREPSPPLLWLPVP